MKRLKSKKVYYEIEKLLGDGLTSQVYKAFRHDGAGWTRQPVALKIIKSKNDVQVLKREFENLSRIRSKYCVRIFAWENLADGPSLVLEYIDGLTLDQILKINYLDHDLILEVLSQVHLGLKALHRGGVIHGDLNLKNIMINKDGIVKLIDFGVAEKGKAQLVTLPFASDSRKQGHVAREEDDFISLQKISEYMAEFCKGPGKHNWMKESPRASRRRRLSQLISKEKKATIQTVRVGSVSRAHAKKQVSHFLIPALLLIAFLFGPSFFTRPPKFVSLTVRSKNWFSYSINGMPLRYGPMEERLFRVGKYQFDIQNQIDKKSSELELSQARTILLKPEDNTLL